MKMCDRYNKIIAVIPFDFVERGTVHGETISRIYELDGTYETSYPGSHDPSGRIIDVKNHMFTSKDGTFVYHVDVDGSKAKFTWFSGNVQKTTWSGRYPPSDLDWMTNNTTYPNCHWTAKGPRRFAAAMYGGRNVFRTAMGGGGGHGRFAQRGPVRGGTFSHGGHGYHGGYHHGGY